MKKIIIYSDHIKLDAFIKWAGITNTGGQAKALILSGAVRVNGELEKRRGCKLSPGDVVTVQGYGEYEITKGPQSR